jgi:apolipoprotein N-acyltransferase
MDKNLNNDEGFSGFPWTSFGYYIMHGNMIHLFFFFNIIE